MKVTQDDLLDALRAALTSPPEGDGMTVQEMAATTDRSIEMVRKALRVFAAEGRLEVVRTRRTTLDGRLGWVPGYRIKPT